METAHERFLFTSCYASKNERVSTAKEWVSYAWQRLHFPCNVIYFVLRFFLTESRTLFALHCEELSFMSTIGRTMYFQSFAQYVWNKLRYFQCWFWGSDTVLTLFFSINLSWSWIIIICYQNDCVPQSSTLNKTIYFSLWKNVSCPCRTFEVLPFWSPNLISLKVVKFKSSTFLKVTEVVALKIFLRV